MNLRRAQHSARGASFVAGRRRVTTVLLLVSVSTSGCSYFGRRLDDACDIFTATGEIRAVGFKAQAGPWGGLGIYGSASDAAGAGLIGGQRTSYDFMDVTMPPFAGFVQKFRNLEDDRRRKEFHVAQSWFVPWLRPQTSPSGFSGGFKEAGDWRRVAPRYTQVEVAIGFWGGIRLGVNFGELIDFLVGWTTLDIFGDDVPPPPLEWEVPVETETDAEPGLESELEPESEREVESQPVSGSGSETDADTTPDWESEWDSDKEADWDTEINTDFDPSRPRP